MGTLNSRADLWISSEATLSLTTAMISGFDIFDHATVIWPWINLSSILATTIGNFVSTNGLF
jgi:hypothetical protein